MTGKNNIIVCEKPEWVAWDVIHDILWEAHKVNREKGMRMRNPALSGKEIGELLRNHGKCFVAMEGNKVIGTCSFVLKKRNRWYARNENLAELIMAAVLPEYQGRGVYKKLLTYREIAVKKEKVHIMEMSTAEHNKNVQNILKRNGFIPVSLRVSSFGKHYSVVMAKRTDEKSYSKLETSLRYAWSYMKIKFLYKPGGVKRFKIW